MLRPTYRIHRDGEISVVGDPQGVSGLSPVIFRVACSLIPKRTTPTGYQYFTWQLLENRFSEPIESNTFVYGDIKCRLASRDSWEIGDNLKEEFSIDGIVLASHITDRNGIERRVLFNNNLHNGQALRDLMAYVIEVGQFSTHEAMKEIHKLRFQLLVQGFTIKNLSEKLERCKSEALKNSDEKVSR